MSLNKHKNYENHVFLSFNYIHCYTRSYFNDNFSLVFNMPFDIFEAACFAILIIVNVYFKLFITAKIILIHKNSLKYHFCLIIYICVAEIFLNFIIYFVIVI
jgi:hypothetical protein